MKYEDKDQILQLTGGGLDIFRAYLPNVTGGKNFRSPFYDDKKASCTIYQDHSGVWRYKDFGNGGSGGDAFWFVGQLFSYNLSSQFPKILAQIVQDLNLPLDITTQESLAKAPIRPQVSAPSSDLPVSQPSMTGKYSVQSQPFTEIDLEFWGKYGINQDTLERYGVSSLASFSSYNRKGKPYQLHYKSTEPMYCYQLGDSVKIYRPNSKVRFLNAGVRSRDYLFGYAQLPSKGECVLLTGGEKDVLSLASHGFSAFCLNSETSHLPKTLLQGLSDRFDVVGVLYDMDDTGVRQSQQILEDNPDVSNLFRIDLPLSGSKSEKDVSDFFFQGGTATALQDIIMRTIQQQDNTMDNLENFIDPKLSGDDIFNLHLTGVQEGYYGNGQLASRDHYKQGVRDGLFEMWHENGQQWIRANFKREKLDGVSLVWHSNGKVHELCHYQNDLLHGEYFRYDESGKLQVHTHCHKGYENLSAWKDSLTDSSVSPFKSVLDWGKHEYPKLLAEFYMDYNSALNRRDQDLADLASQRIDPHVHESDILSRKLTGVQEAYYDNGQISNRKFYKDGLPEGMGYSWYRDGQLAGRCSYKRGKPEGVGVSFYDNGQLEERATFKAGRREGVSERWYLDGQLSERCSYKNGLADGVRYVWFPNGELARRCEYNDDRLNGLSEEWYDNGQLRSRNAYKAGKLDGLCEFWDEGGNLLTQTHYENNKKNGLHFIYDPESGEMCYWVLFENNFTVQEGKPEELEQLEAYKDQTSKVVVPSSPVQEKAQAILDARGERNNNTLKNAQVNKSSLKI